MDRPWDGSSRGRIVKGTDCQGDGLSRGQIVQGTDRPGDALSVGQIITKIEGLTVMGTDRLDTLQNEILKLI
jgi:hypothetical protein